MLDLIKLRRDLHEHPEVGFTEFRTAGKVVELLESFNIKVNYGEEVMDGPSRRGVPDEEILEQAYERALRDGANPKIIEKMKGGYTAVIGEIEGNQPGPVVAFRFDMDALPILESDEADHVPAAENFRSKYKGNMHACGHDGHTTTGIGLAEKLRKGDFPGKVKLIFQPAEEGVRGAYSLVQKGVLDDVDYLYCFHLGTGVPLGEFHGGTGGFLATTKLRADFSGTAAHAGASPEHGRNALLAAATATLNIHAIPRFSEADTRINVGVLQSGAAANIIPEHAKLIMETRSSSEKVNKELVERVESIVKSSAAMQGVTAEIEVIGGAIPINCDKELVDLAQQEAQHIPGFKTISQGSSDSALGSEDASYMIRRVQENGGKATYMVVGVNHPAPHHHPKFDIQEEALFHAVSLLERLARKTLSDKKVVVAK